MLTQDRNKHDKASKNDLKDKESVKRTPTTPPPHGKVFLVRNGCEHLNGHAIPRSVSI